MPASKKTVSKSIHDDQSGLASLVIAILIVLVIVSLVLGFMQIIRREQRRTLDNQLSAQAYYAAETGVNDAITAIKKQGYTSNKTTCDPLLSATPAALTTGTNKLTTDGNVQYTCLLIDQAPPSAEYGMEVNKSYVLPLNSGGGDINQLKFEWKNKITNPQTLRPNSTPLFSSLSSWGNAMGVLRVDLMPASNLNNTVLVNLAKTFFLYPQKGGSGTPVYSFLGSGSIVAGSCSPGNGTGVHRCKANFTGLPTGLIYARISALYAPFDVTITGNNASGTLTFQNAQAVIDSTGKAADVSRRIQVRVPTSSIDYPQNVITSMGSLCKKFEVTATSGLTADPANPTECDPN